MALAPHMQAEGVQNIQQAGFQLYKATRGHQKDLFQLSFTRTLSLTFRFSLPPSSQKF
ncbi:unnamed protein product [Gulo gulo]|uniref:Uncharacterized protein n=1 Tax=Gulo gulo TaxID=48420 RepID=A0A9X9MB61_GULGU|nr:unnamed protein product [Gulo gulo]